MADLSVEVVLVPVDGSDEAMEAVAYALAIAAAYGAQVHVLYVFGEASSREVRDGSLTPDDLATEAQTVFADIEAEAGEQAVELGFSTARGFSPTRKLVHPGSVVLDTADEVDADFIVIPRETHPDEPPDVLEKTAEYVLLYASQPVLSV